MQRRAIEQARDTQKTLRDRLAVLDAKLEASPDDRTLQSQRNAIAGLLAQAVQQEQVRIAGDSSQISPLPPCHRIRSSACAAVPGDSIPPPERSKQWRALSRRETRRYFAEIAAVPNLPALPPRKAR